MDKESIDVILSKIEVLANKLGVTAEYMFGVYCKQVCLEAITQLFVIPVLMIIGVLWYGLAKRWHKKIVDEELDSEGKFFIYAISIILAVGLVVAVSALSIDSTKGLYNPEYYAMTKLLWQIK